MLSADLKLETLSQVFGKDNLRVIDYDASSSSKSLLQDFVGAMGITWSDTFVRSDDNPDAVNRSMDVADIEVIRALNHTFAKHYGKTGSWVREQYTKNQSVLNNVGLAELKELITANQRELLIGNYFIDNRCERIMAEKFKSNMLNYQATQDTKKITIANDDWVLEVKAQEILAKLVSVLREITG